MRHPDDGLTSQDHESREYQAADVVLMFAAILGLAALLAVCLISWCMGGFPYEGGGIIGF